MGISLHTPVTEDNLISLDSGQVGSYPLSAELASNRAMKASLGLPNINKTYQDYYDAFVSGGEDTVRNEVASENNFRRNAKKQELIAALASKKNAPLVDKDIQDIEWALSQDKTVRYTDPSSIFEEAYASAYMNYLDLSQPGNENTFLAEAEAEIPVEANAYKEAGREAIAKHEFFRRIADDAEENFSQQSWPSFAVDVGKMALPAYYEYKLRGRAPDTGVLQGGPLGENLEEQRKTYYRMPLNQMKEAFIKDFEKLKSDNPYAALHYAKAMLGRSADEIGLDNIFSLVEASFLAQAGKQLATGAKGLWLKRFMKEAVKSSVDEALKNEPTAAAIAKGAGDVGEAAVKEATSIFLNKLAGQSKPIQDNLKNMLSFYKLDIDNLVSGVNNSTRELTTRIVSQTSNFMNNLSEVVAEIARVNRIPELDAVEGAIKGLKENISEIYPGLSNRIIDISNLRREPVSNTFHINITLGKNNAELFDRPTVAQNAAKAFNLPDAKVVQVGRGWALQVTKPLDETQDLVRNLLTTTRESTDPEGWLSSFFHWIRTPEETLSIDNRIQRKVATYAPSWLLQVAQDEALYIKKLYKGKGIVDPVTGEKVRGRIFSGKKTKRWEDWNSIVKLARTSPDPDTGELGYFYKNVAELQDSYQRHLHRLADDAEVEAYFAYKRLLEMDRIFRNSAVYRSKVRVGAETHTPLITSSPGQARVTAPTFDGMVHKYLPGTKDTILVLSKEVGKEGLYRGGEIPPSVLKRLTKEIEDGKKLVVEIFDPEARPFNGFGKVKEERVRYVIADKLETKPISWEQVPRRGGGHWEYDYNFYIKQARIRAENINGVFRHWYEGDTTIMPMSIGSAARDIAKHLDQVRILIKDGDLKAAKKYSETHLPIDWKEVSGWFRSHKVNGETIPARLSKYEPIEALGRDETIIGKSKDLENRYTRITDTGERVSTFMDGTKHGSAARQQTVQFTGSRDSYELMTLNPKGSKHNPIFNYEPAKMLDPIPSMDRALSNIINSAFFDDYKIMSVEHWLASAQQYLKPHVNDIRSAPFWHFHNPDFKTDAPFDAVQRLKANHWQIQQFLGQTNAVDNFLTWSSQRLADIVYDNVGTKGLLIAPDHLLGAVKDASRFMRSVAFNAKLGLFAVPQLIVQSQTYGVIAGVAGPTRAAQGTAAAFMTQLSRINKNPAILDKLDETLSKMGGWKRGEFKESLDELRKTGFGNIMGEYALIDDALSPRIFRSRWGDFLHAGQVFFREGERSVRYGAWHTAFREFREANPTGRITAQDRQNILNRADLLSVNMSRASNSALHSGVFSIPTQFLTYQMRLAELFFGKRLTMAERGKLVFMQSFLYGIPIATGVTGVPLGDSIRQYALEHGYVVGDSWYTTLMEGVPAALVGYATNNWYNVGDRLGSQGFEVIREAWNEDADIFKIIFGASGATIGGFVSSSMGFYQAVKSMLGDGGESFPVKTDDLLDVFNEISSVNNARRAWYAANTGNWLSKKGLVLERGVSGSDALIRALTGLQSTDASDLHLKSMSIRDRVSNEKAATQRFMVEFRRAMRVHADDPEAARAHYIRARNFLIVYGIPQERWPSIFRQATADRGSLIEQLDWSFYTKNVPDDMKDAMLKAYGRQLNRQGR